MSRYQPLSDRLSGHLSDEWRASFAEIEAVLGFALPKAARTGRAWWSKPPQNQAWTAVGWDAAVIDRDAEAVTFRKAATARVDPVPAILSRLETPPPSGLHLAGVAAMLAGSVAVAVGLGALAFRAVRRSGSKTSL